MRCFVSLGLLTAFVLTIAGCKSGPEVLPAGQHPPLAQEQVKIYQDVPLKYEVLGTVTQPVAADAKWDEKGDATAGFNRLRAAAGKMGGNGLLLQGDAGEYDLRIGAGFEGKFYQVPLKSNPRTAVAKAIFVHEE